VQPPQVPHKPLRAFACFAFHSFGAQAENEGGAADPAAAVDVVEELRNRVEALEVGAKYDATKEEVHKVQEEFLLKLRDIRSALRRSAAATAPGGGGGNRKELEQALAENAELEKRNAKLEYRVEHIVAEMERLYNENKGLNRENNELQSKLDSMMQQATTAADSKVGNESDDENLLEI